jgi:hypothetical protein
MDRVRGWVAIGGLLALGSVAAQPTRPDAGSPPRVEKPVSRYYGSVQPPGAPTAQPPVSRPHPGGGAPAYVDRPAPSHGVPPRHDRHGSSDWHRPRTRVDIVIGTPLPPPRPYYYGPRYYPPRPVYPPAWSVWPPPVYAPPAVVVPPPVVLTPPPVYVERGDVAGAETPPAAGYWYWCADPQGWYPELTECPVGWQPVLPRPAP